MNLLCPTPDDNYGTLAEVNGSLGKRKEKLVSILSPTVFIIVSLPTEDGSAMQEVASVKRETTCMQKKEK